jgi:hypothetical protein
MSFNCVQLLINGTESSAAIGSEEIEKLGGIQPQKPSQAILLGWVVVVVIIIIVVVVHHLCHHLEELGLSLHLSFHHLLHTKGTSLLLLPVLLHARCGGICGLE